MASPTGLLPSQDFATAARTGDLTALNVALAGDSTLVDEPNARGITALMEAAHGGHLNVTTALLEAKASVDKQDPEGRTALGFCASSDNSTSEITTALLGARAQADHKDFHKYFALMQASREARPDICAALLKGKASVDERDSLGRTALMWACRTESEKSGKCDALESTVRLLLTSGADINLQDNAGCDASHGQFRGQKLVLKHWTAMDTCQRNVVSRFGWEFRDLAQWDEAHHKYFPDYLRCRATAVAVALDTMLSSHAATLVSLVVQQMDVLDNSQGYRQGEIWGLRFMWLIISPEDMERLRTKMAMGPRKG